MSVRRLAPSQPGHFAFTGQTLDVARAWLAKYPEGRQRSAVIPLLWLAQKQAGGWLPEPAIRVVADMLDMPYMRAYEVATFYTMFNLAPQGEHFVQVCGTTPCMLRGAEALREICKRKINPKPNAPSADGKLSWLEVECLGACVNAPMAQISNAAGDHYYEDLTPETFEKLLDDLAAGRPVTPGPQGVDRQRSAPQGGAKALTDPTLYDGSRAAPLTLPNLPEPVVEPVAESVGEPAGDASSEA